MSNIYGLLPENEFHDEWNTFTSPNLSSSGNDMLILSTCWDNMTDGNDMPNLTDGNDMPNLTDGNDMPNQTTTSNDMSNPTTTSNEIPMISTFSDNMSDGDDIPTTTTSNDIPTTTTSNNMPVPTTSNDMPAPTNGNDMRMLSTFSAFADNTVEDHQQLEELSSQLHKLVADMATKRCRRKRFRQAGGAGADGSTTVTREQTDGDVIKFIGNKCNTDASESIHRLVTEFNTRCGRDKCCPASNCQGQLFFDSSACPRQLLAKGLLVHGRKLGIVVAPGKQITANSTISEYTGKKVASSVVRTWKKDDPRRTYMVCIAQDDASTEAKAGAFYIVPKLRRCKTRPELSNHAALVRSAVHSHGKGVNCRLVTRDDRVWLCSLDNPIVSGDELFIDM